MAVSLDSIFITKIVAVYNVNFKDNRCAVRRDRQYCALAYKIEGRTEYTCDNKSCIADSNHLVLIPPHKPYLYNLVELGTSIMIEFECDREICEFESYKISDSVKMRNIFTDIWQMWMAKNDGYTLEILSAMYKMLHTVYVFGNLDYAIQKKEKLLRPAIEYIRENYANGDISNEKLAFISNMSTVYFRKLFSQRYGISPMRYVGNIRIENAKNMLLSDNYSVSEIAEATGFSSVYSFSRAFKKATSLSPSEFLKINSEFSI